VSIEESRPTPAIKVMDEIDDETDRCIVLAGPTGTGKTHPMIAGFRRFAVWHRSKCVYWTFAALVRALINDGSDEVLEHAVEADLLAIDDMGSTYMKPDGVAEAGIEEIVVEREANEALTLLTTNLTLIQFRDVFGDRIADRIAGDWGDWHAVTGESMRKKTRRPARG
jgi:DNA replication protein DnaC